MTQAMSMKNLPVLPRGWVWARLGDIVGFVKGKKPKKLGIRNNLFTVPYIDINAFENKIFDKFTDADNCPLCQTNDILIVWDGARCGLVGRGVAGAIGSTLAKLPCFDVNSSYIFYFLQSMYEFINKRPRGVGIPHVEPSVFWNISVPLPPLPEQRRIVVKIEELFTKRDAGVVALKKIKAQLKRYRQAVLEHVFQGKFTAEWRQAHKHELEPASILVERINQERQKNAKGKNKEVPLLNSADSPELPEGWVWVLIDQIAHVGTGATPLRSNKKYYESGTVPWVTSSALNKPFITKTEEMITELAIKETNAKIFPVHTLLVAMYGEGKTRGKVSELLIEAATNQACAALVFEGQTTYIRPFVKMFLLKNYEDLRRLASGGVQPNLNLGMIKITKVPLPSLKEQQEIVVEIERRFSVADEIENTVDHGLKQAERLRQSILKRAFEGKLVPQNPNDEPAEKLLERVKREKTLSDITKKSERETGITSRKIINHDRTGKPAATKSLYDVLRSSGKRMTPSELLEISGLSIQDFYEQLSGEISAGRIKEHRPNSNDVFLEVGN